MSQDEVTMLQIQRRGQEQKHTDFMGVGMNPVSNSKCPFNHPDRIFRMPETGSADITLADCFGECSSVDGCSHFSWGPWEGAYVCMGCTTLENADAHDGITAYDMPLNPQSDTKCPLNHADRLFREPPLAGGSSDVTLTECLDLCGSTEGCNHFSWGPWQGQFVCMGCSSLDNAQHHEGITAYDMPGPPAGEAALLLVKEQKRKETSPFMGMGLNPVSNSKCPPT